MPPDDQRVPLFLNPHAGAGEALAETFEQDPRVEVRRVEPLALCEAVARAVRNGAARVIVAGGDGSIALAAREVIGSATVLGIIPAGTLNHFARDLGIPLDPALALELALTGRERMVDVGSVNGQPFLNTSSVGAYIAFVRQREALEKHLGYRLASVMAALRLAWSLRPFRVELTVEGESQARSYRTPLLFVGVGERELRFPQLGSRVEDGRSGLQLIVTRGSSARSLLALAWNGMVYGIRSAARSPHADVLLVDRCRVLLRRRGPVAVDGEVAMLDSPLDYELRRGALRVVAPEPGEGGSA
jgi:diacylglycerol kinase family enzyme